MLSRNRSSELRRSSGTWSSGNRSFRSCSHISNTFRAHLVDLVVFKGTIPLESAASCLSLTKLKHSCVSGSFSPEISTSSGSEHKREKALALVVAADDGRVSSNRRSLLMVWHSTHARQSVHSHIPKQNGLEE